MELCPLTLRLIATQLNGCPKEVLDNNQRTTNTVAVSSTLHHFNASAGYGLQGRSANTLFPRTVQYRWDFGDGSPYVVSVGPQASHQYLCGADNQHTMRVELTDNYGTVIIGSKDVDVSKSCATNVGPKSQLYLPVVRK